MLPPPPPDQVGQRAPCSVFPVFMQTGQPYRDETGRHTRSAAALAHAPVLLVVGAAASSEMPYQTGGPSAPAASSTQNSPEPVRQGPPIRWAKSRIGPFLFFLVCWLAGWRWPVLFLSPWRKYPTPGHWTRHCPGCNLYQNLDSVLCSNTQRQQISVGK